MASLHWDGENVATLKDGQEFYIGLGQMKHSISLPCMYSLNDEKTYINWFN